ncbi:nuclear RNA export factor 2-like isoform X2 [Erinaceus europaeus]|uniref:Nuclear RNA export factor 2-like isoform X2 n=1 Tax=Erinaceus europaeus TaxID=9365 RepID=A0ABM3WSL9_ERIEU|nr:nuclear RNA export factor 2-like isoform X2 [Erinaceus europaeus]
MSERQEEQKRHLQLMKRGADGNEEYSGTFQEEDDSVEMRDVQDELQVRHTPCNVTHKRKVKWHYQSQIHITVWKNKKALENKVGETMQDRTLRNWFKVTIPWGRKYDKEWLMNSIQNHCSVPFTPVDFHYVRNRARFFIQDSSIASELKDVSYKICDEENQKICIFVNKCAAPFSVQNKLEPEEMYQLEMTMNKRYDVTQQALDLQTLRFDPDLVGHEIDIILNRRNCMSAALKIIEKNFPNLLSLNLCNNKLYQLDGLCDIIPKAPMIKILNLSNNELSSTWEVSKIKGLKLEELWLEGNPLCDTFSDQLTYVSVIRSYFPKLRCLDGQNFTSPTALDISSPDLVKPCQKTCKEPEELRNLIRQFLRQYYSLYDNGDRQGLLAAYHEESCFSLSVSSNPEDIALNSLCDIYKESRNMKMIKDDYLRLQLLKHTKHDVVRSLCVLPKTQHDLNSFVVDLLIQTDTMLCFSVHGVFKEVEGSSQGSLRAFVRTFITTPGCCSNLCIMNDELFVRVATAREAQCSLSLQTPTSVFNFKPTLSQEQQEMVQSFSTQSGMNFHWSQKCLQDNEWNYIKACEVFIMLKTEGRIPMEAFQ